MEAENKERIAEAKKMICDLIDRSVIPLLRSVLHRRATQYADAVKDILSEEKAVPVGDFRDAYEGAREDLLDWKGRAQRAEAELRMLGYTGIDANHPPERDLDVLDEIECDLPSLFGRASLEGHESGQRLAKEVREKLKEGVKVLRKKVSAREKNLTKEIALELWHRFANETTLVWGEEIHQSEYTHAAEAIISIVKGEVRPAPKKNLRCMPRSVSHG